MNNRDIFFSVCLALSSNTALSATLDVDAIMTSSAKPIVDSLRQQCIGGNIRSLSVVLACGARYPLEPLFGNVTFASGETRISDFSRSPIPNSATTRTHTIENCGSTSLAFTETVSTNITSQLSVATKDSVKSSRSLGAKATLDLGLVEPAEINGQILKEISFERVETKNESVQESYSLKVDKVVPAYSALVIQREFGKFRSAFEFDGDIHVDGQLLVKDNRSKLGALVPSDNYYSSLMNGNDKITVRGSVRVDDHEEGNIRYTEVPLDPALCRSRVSLFTGRSSSSHYSPLMRSEAVAPYGTSVAQESAISADELTDGYKMITKLVNDPERTTATIVSSHTFTTANVIANVLVRARSSGGESCSATLLLGDDQKVFDAPAQQWSEWSPLETHFGETFYDVYSHSDCSSDVEIEISYYQ